MDISSISLVIEDISDSVLSVSSSTYKLRDKCIHNKRFAYCTKCGGDYICSHGKQKYACKECGGTLFCEHGINKYNCVT